MLSFNQFINESEDNDFDKIDAGDIVRWKGSKVEVEKRVGLSIKIGNRLISKSQWKERGGELIEKRAKKNEK
jgi:hypothetical protein